MSNPPVAPAGVTPATTTTAAQSDDFKSPESKQAVLDDLAKERGERQKLQAEVEKLKPLQDQMAKLASAFGDQNVGPDQDIAAKVAGLNDTVKSLLKDNLVLSIAGEFGLTDADRQMVSKLPDEATMRAVAARLAEASKASGKPQADPPSRGTSSKDGAPDVDLPGMARLRAAYKAAEEAQ